MLFLKNKRKKSVENWCGADRQTDGRGGQTDRGPITRRIMSSRSSRSPFIKKCVFSKASIAVTLKRPTGHIAYLNNNSKMKFNLYRPSLEYKYKITRQPNRVYLYLKKKIKQIFKLIY